MDMYASENRLMISAENIPELYSLILQAKEEANQLNNTLSKLARFELTFAFSVNKSGYAGGIDAARSESKSMFTK